MLARLLTPDLDTLVDGGDGRQGVQAECKIKLAPRDTQHRTGPGKPQAQLGSIFRLLSLDLVRHKEPHSRPLAAHAVNHALGERGKTLTGLALPTCTAALCVCAFKQLMNKQACVEALRTLSW